MKLVSLPIGNDRIDVHNNFFTGWESIYFNGHRVSHEFNWFTGIHNFRVANKTTGVVDNYRVEFHTSWRKWYGVAIDVYKNGECLLNQSGNMPSGDVYTLEVADPAQDNDPYDRSSWYEPAERVARPVYREEDLV